MVTSTLIVFASLFADSHGDGAGARTTPEIVQIRHRTLGTCLDVPGANAQNGQSLWTWQCGDDASQQWWLNGDHLANKRIEIKYAADNPWTYPTDQTKCLDVPNGDFTNGNWLELWDCGGYPQQHWKWDSTIGTISSTINGSGIKCLAMADQSGADGASVWIWDCDTTTDNAMLWDIEQYSPPAPPPLDPDQTPLTAQLNDQIRRGDNGVFTGGKGVLVRNPLDAYEEMSWKVVPSTFWVNDIFTASQLYVTAVANNVDCPNDGTNGYYTLSTCSADPEAPTVTGGWDYASMAYVIGTKMNQVMEDYDNIQSSDWGFGVFYPTDSNGVDSRCHRTDSNYDCPGGILADDGTFAADATRLGSGDYPAGNPDANASWGGGTGCHFDIRLQLIDQTDAYDPVTHRNLVSDYNCQCDYGWKTGDEFDWGNFVDTWVNYAEPKTGTAGTDPWFKGGKAPNRGLDLVSCWVNNPRDMINLQNQFWWKKLEWNNQMAPKASWGKDPASHRVYWGWNEVPISKTQAADRALRDAVMIRLPAAVCGGDGINDSPKCLSDSAGKWLEKDIEEWVTKGHLKLGHNRIGQKPGSNLVFVRAFVDSSGNWGQKFFCENWSSPSSKYMVVFTQVDECYLDTFATEVVA